MNSFISSSICWFTQDRNRNYLTVDRYHASLTYQLPTIYADFSKGMMRRVSACYPIGAQYRSRTCNILLLRQASLPVGVIEHICNPKPNSPRITMCRPFTLISRCSGARGFGVPPAWCSMLDSNQHFNDFKSFFSANWNN